MRPSPHVSWFVEFQGITVVRRGAGSLSIPYPQAGLWALIAHENYSTSRAVELMSVLLSIERQEAEKSVEATLAAWRQEGIVVES